MPRTGHTLSDLAALDEAWVEWDKSHFQKFPRLRWRVPGPGPKRKWRKASRYLGAQYRDALRNLNGQRITTATISHIEETLR